MNLWDAIAQIWEESGFARLLNFENGGWKNLIMIGIACVLLFLAIKKKYEPLLLLPIAFGMLLVNLPLGGVMDPQQNSLVPFTHEEQIAYISGTYEQVYPVSITEFEIDDSNEKNIVKMDVNGFETDVYNLKLHWKIW